MTSDSSYKGIPPKFDDFSEAGRNPPLPRQAAKRVQGASGEVDPRVEAAKLIRRLRSCRTELMPPHLFGEASWDILLALYVAHREQYRMTIMTVCNEAGVPLTTALRWLQQLVDEGLAVRRNNPLDRRTVHVELAPSAIQAMDRLMDSVLNSDT